MQTVYHHQPRRYQIEDWLLHQKLQRVEFKKITVRLPENFRSNNVRVKVLHNSAEAGFIADFQRDYGASSLNERSLPAEIVMRITR